MPSIKAIDATSVQRLHAGQVVLELQGAVKELVENSIDAGATTVEVRFKDSGLDSLEVMDNGSGIPQEDWGLIGKKHHTSKLEDIVSLPLVTTFGFRGEALSALCALCDAVTVTTATAETAPMGAVIQLAKDGSVKDSTGRVARPRGTTILLQGLFIPLPVRRKEFERTIKREYTKALNLLNAYALVPASTSTKDGRSGVRLKVEAVGSGRSGKRSTLLTTDGRGSLRSSVTSVWGPKALEGVLDINLDLQVEIDAVMARREGISQGTQTVKVVGLISSAAWGQGRTSPDRQYYYINGRPCDLKQVAKAINEVYRSFNTNQSPLAVLDFQVPPESIDINVSPDKRTIFLHSEVNLLAALRTALEAFFAPSRSAFPLGGASSTVKIVQSQAVDSAGPEDLDEGVDVEEEVAPAPAIAGRAASPMSTAITGDDAEDDPEALTEADLAPGVPGVTLPTASDGVNAEAGPSRLPFSLKPYTLTREEAQKIYSSPLKSSTSSRSSHASAGPSTSARSFRLPTRTSGSASLDVAGDSESPPRRRPAQQTLDTTLASWSSGRAHDKGKGSTQSGPKKGKDARVDLRQRLAGFASQGQVVPAVDDEDGAEDEAQDGNDREGDEDGDDDDDTNDEDVDEEESDSSDSEDEHESRGDGVVADGAAQDGPAQLTALIAPAADDGDVEMEDGEEDIFALTTPGRGSASEGSREPISSSSRAPPAASQKTPTSKRTDISAPTDTSLRTPRSGLSTNARRKASGYRSEITSTAAAGERTLRFDMARTRARCLAAARSAKQQEAAQRDAFSALAEGGISAAAGLKNKDAVEAEQALSRVISKADFEKMEVLGQFNLGFIIARLRIEGGEGKKASDDLFIIDQHASDEKFNFETLQRTTVIKAQKLIKPRPLQLTAGDEIVAMENLPILKANGFGVVVDEDQAPGRGERIKLSAMPISKETVFDFKDLEQLLHLLADGARPSGQMVRCSKARTMFASRACRKSVMIGKSLTKNQMAQLLRNMGTIDQPWNCPHGRPTMRHLVKLERPRDAHSRIDWSEWKARQ